MHGWIQIGDEQGNRLVKEQGKDYKRGINRPTIIVC